jgi:hypothetical protein
MDVQIVHKSHPKSTGSQYYYNEFAIQFLPTSIYDNLKINCCCTAEYVIVHTEYLYVLAIRVALWNKELLVLVLVRGMYVCKKDTGCCVNRAQLSSCNEQQNLPGLALGPPIGLTAAKKNCANNNNNLR